MSQETIKDESNVSEAVEAILEFKRIKSLPENQRTTELKAWEEQIDNLHFISDKKSSEPSLPDEAIRSVQWYYQMDKGNLDNRIQESIEWKRFTKRLNFDAVLKKGGMELPEPSDLDYSEHHSSAIIAVLWYQQLLSSPSNERFEEFDSWKSYVYEVGRRMTLSVVH